MQSSTTTTLFPQQQRLLNQLPEIQLLLKKYERPQEWIDVAEKYARHFIVRVPLIGAFSSGKSTILNALIGENLFATNIDPETAVPAELGYSPNESFIACYPDGNRAYLSRDEIINNQLSGLHPNGWVEVYLSAAELAKLPHLRLVDMPGWGSGNNKHRQAIDNYSPRSLAYCLVVSADEGTLNESTRTALNELRLHDMPIIVIISKCDKRPADDVYAITQQVGAEVEKLLGMPPLAIVQVTTRKHELEQLRTALAKLELQTESLFVQNVVKPLLLELRLFSQYLKILINKDDLNSEEIAVERMSKVKEIEDFNEKLKKNTERLVESLPKVLTIILRLVQDRLTEQLDTMTSLAEAGQDLHSLIENTVRQAVTQGIRDEFDPKIQSYFEKINSDLPKDLQLDFRIPSSRQINTDESDNGSDDKVKKSILFSIELFLTKHPIGKELVKILMPIIDALYDFFSSTADKEIKSAQRREFIRQSILGKIPEIVVNVEGKLRPLLKEYVENARLGIAQAVQDQRQTLDAALIELDKKLKEGKAAYVAAQHQYQADQQVIQVSINLFENV